VESRLNPVDPDPNPDPVENPEPKLLLLLLLEKPERELNPDDPKPNPVDPVENAGLGLLKLDPVETDDENPVLPNPMLLFPETPARLNPTCSSILFVSGLKGWPGGP